MGVGQALGDFFGQVEADVGFAVGHGGISCLRGLENQQAVVGKLRQNEDKHHGEDDPQRLVLLEVLGLQERADDDGVAEDHDHQGKPEAHADLDGQDQDLDSVFAVVPVDQSARGLVMVGLHRGVDELGEGQEGGEHPDDQADEFAAEQPLLLRVLSLGHLHDGDVAVHADAGEQQHAAEEVDLVDS